MPDSDKNIIIRPNRGATGSTAQPQIRFVGQNNDPITLRVLDMSGSSAGTLSFEGSAGQLFAITNALTSGSLFSVNDISGLPSIDVNANGTILFAGFTGNVGIGAAAGISASAYRLTVIGSTNIVGGITASTLYVSQGSTFASNIYAPNLTIFTQGATAPSSPNAGDRWYDTESGKLFVAVTDDGSRIWVEFGGVAAVSADLLPLNWFFGT